MLILGVGREGALAFSTSPVELAPEDGGRYVWSSRPGEAEGFFTLRLGDTERVGRGFFFEPFSWYVVLTEARTTFYQDVEKITTQTIYIVAGCILFASLARVLLRMVSPCAHCHVRTPPA